MRHGWPCRSIGLLALMLSSTASAQTIALWPFDEQQGLYPSCVLGDVSANNYPMVIGPGGQIVDGRFGNALEPIERSPVQYPEDGSVQFGLTPPPGSEKRRIEPLMWKNANFCGLITHGEKHLRREVRFVNPAATKLNLGDFDWTVEFWFYGARKTAAQGVVFEIGRGPRGEVDDVTQLLLNPGGKSFTFVNTPSSMRLVIPSDPHALHPRSGQWHHLAFVYSRTDSQLRHYVNGRVQPLPRKALFRALDAGDESYFSVGRDGLWQRPLPGRIDELRFSEGQIYSGRFTPPLSFSPVFNREAPSASFKAGPALLFTAESKDRLPILLENRKHLFIDDVLLERSGGVQFSVNPPRLDACVIDNIKGPFRKHLNVVEDEQGTIRLYYSVDDDYLAVQVSKDGLHWESPSLNNGTTANIPNVVLAEPTGMGMVFIDPNAPPAERWKYLSDYHRQGIYLFSSPDGWSFKRHPIAVLPFRAGSQSNIFYDDQRQVYVSYHRTDFPTTIAGNTQREFVVTESKDLNKPWPFAPLTQAQTQRIAKTKRLHNLIPWYLDNGPLTPGGFGVEYPTAFAPDDSLDPVGTDLYSPKALKYPWAPDTYLAFPLVYFHYEDDGPAPRRILGEENRERGSGPIETQVAVSRDGLHWKRYPRPAYVGTGRHHGDTIHQTYLAQGMVRRGNEIWQYYFGEEAYHSSWKKGTKRAVYRVAQRLDGFISADAPYDKSVSIVTKPLIFRGNRLWLNIDTEATGFAQVGLMDETGQPIQGYSLDDCVYINGDFVETEVEWLGKGKNISKLEGKVIRLALRMRGTKLYSLQFR